MRRHTNAARRDYADTGLQKMCELEQTSQGHGRRVFNKYIIVWRANQPSVQKTASARPRIAEDIRNVSAIYTCAHLSWH